ncbi:MAG TPA: hypothetical protein PLZ16_05645, partial [Gammaproteobacteria bacterium]|nr:hypothetical protein [Gammaproteobacteria bacterium]
LNQGLSIIMRMTINRDHFFAGPSARTAGYARYTSETKALSSGKTTPSRSGSLLGNPDPHRLIGDATPCIRTGKL